MYKIKIEITDSEGEPIVGGATVFDYEDVGAFGECGKVDEELGKVMRRLVHRVESKESIHDLEAELIANGQIN